MEITLVILALACIVLIALYVIQMKKTALAAADTANLVASNQQLHDDAERSQNEVSRLQADVARLNESLVRLREENARLTAEADFGRQSVAKLEEDNRRSEEALKRHSQSMLEQSEARFKVLANDILSQHTSRLASTNQEALGTLLDPLRQNIDSFRRDVTSFYSKEAAERFSLQERIRELIEANNSIGKEARELSLALRGNSEVQGDWGEIVLETILENSGLRKGEEFEVQLTRGEDGSLMKNEDGQALRPDVVVRYPGGKMMVIDSKVSLTAFVEYVNSNSDEERERYGRLHLTSITKHVAELGRKNYQDYLGGETLDFVMMFVPNESAYSAAMTMDPSLWQKAYDKRVLIVSPTQLVASLKIVSQLWLHDRQTRNAIDIAERAGAMYDKFVGFLADMEKIERSINTTRTAFDAAMNKLRDGTGSLVVRAEKLRELGAKAAKRIAK